MSDQASRRTITTGHDVDCESRALGACDCGGHAVSVEYVWCEVTSRPVDIDTAAEGECTLGKWKSKQAPCNCNHRHPPGHHPRNVGSCCPSCGGTGTKDAGQWSGCPGPHHELRIGPQRTFDRIDAYQPLDPSGAEE